MINGDFNIIDKTLPPKALYDREPTPTSWKTKYDHDKYWDEQQRRWREGYSGLTPFHYFYIQEIKQKNIHGGVTFGHWRDVDSIICEADAELDTLKQDLFLVKRKEIGWSTLGMAKAIYTAITKPGSTSVLTSADKDRLKELYAEKFLVAYNGLHPSIRPAIASTRQEGYVLFAEKGDKKGSATGLNSKIVSRETVKNPTAVEAYRAMFAMIDEIFLHPKPNQAKASMSGTIIKNMERVGNMWLGGTCGKGMLKGYELGRQMWIDSKKNDLLTLFLGGTMGHEKFSINGWSQEQAAREWILKKREQLYQAEDKTDYFKFITDNPLSAPEVFNLTTESIWQQDVLVILDRAEKAIEAEGVIQKYYFLSREGDGVRMDPAPEGVETPFTIIETVQKGLIYPSGTDPIPFSNNAIGDGSSYSLTIKNPQTNRHIANYYERNLDINHVFNHTTMLQDLFNKSRTMIELNQGGAIFQLYLAQRPDLLAPMPLHVGITFEKRLYDFCYAKNTHTDKKLNEYLLAFLYRYGYNIRLKKLIEEIRKFTLANTDVLDSVLAELLYSADLEEQMKIMTPTSQVTRRNTIEWKNGQRVRKVVEENYNTIPNRRRR